MYVLNYAPPNFWKHSNRVQYSYLLTRFFAVLSVFFFSLTDVDLFVCCQTGNKDLCAITKIHEDAWSYGEVVIDD